MTILQLQYFVETARETSISRAAAKLFISQQALSRALLTLEEELGTTLFNRTAQGIHLTMTGEKIRVIAEKFLSEYDNYSAMILNVVAHEENYLNICYESYPHIQMIPKDMQGKIGDIRINSLGAHGMQQCMELVLEKRADLAYVSPPKNSGELLYIPIIDEPGVVIVNKNHVLAGKSEIHLRELENERLLSSVLTGSLIDDFRNACLSEGFFPAKSTEYPMIQMVLAAVSRGEGYMYGGSPMRFGKYEETLTRIPLCSTNLRFRTGVLIHPDNKHNVKILSYIRALERIFEAQPEIVTE